MSKSFLSRSGVWGAALSLTKATIGTGVLARPWTTRSVGLPLMGVLLFVSALLTHRSICILAAASEATGLSGYDEIADRVFNGKIAFFAGIAMFGNCFGSAIAYVIAIGDALKWVGVDPLIVQLVVCSFCIVPLVWIYNIDNLRYFSFLGIVGVSLLTLTAPYVLMRHGVASSISENPGEIFFWKFDPVAMMDAFSSITFAFVCQYNVPSIYQELSDRSASTIAQVSRRSICLTTTLFVIVSVCGYLAFGNSLADNMLKNLQTYIDERDIFVLVAVIGCVVSICIAHALHVYPIRQTGEYAVKKLLSKPPKHKKLFAAFLGTVTVYASLLFALTFPSFRAVITLVGAFASGAIAYIFPPLFHMKLHHVKTRKFFDFPALYLDYVILLIGVIAGTLGTYTAVLSAIKASQL